MQLQDMCNELNQLFPDRIDLNQLIPAIEYAINLDLELDSNIDYVCLPSWSEQFTWANKFTTDKNWPVICRVCQIVSDTIKQKSKGWKIIKVTCELINVANEHGFIYKVYYTNE